MYDTTTEEARMLTELKHSVCSRTHTHSPSGVANEEVTLFYGGSAASACRFASRRSLHSIFRQGRKDIEEANRGESNVRKMRKLGVIH